MKKKLLIVIFLIAVVLRFWNLAKYPEAVDEDEMALGYYAYSLIHNGTDEYGNKFPIYFESAGDYKYGLYSYLDTVPVALFGLNPFSTRSVAALAGALSVIAIFYLVKEISDNDEIALISAFVLAVSPTHIHFSRVAYNNILGGLFAILSLYYLLRWLKKDGNKQIILTFLFFILSIFSYQAYRVFLPATFFLFFVILFRRFKKAKRNKAIFVVILSFLIVGLSFISPKSRARSQSITSLVNKPELVENFSEDNLAGSSLLVTRIMHNKVTVLSLGFAQRYFSYFDPVFLFSQTSSGVERHSTPEVGLLYLIEAPLLFLGILFSTKLLKDERLYLPYAMLFAAPVGASLVVADTSTTRAVVIVYAYAILVSLGIYYLFRIKRIGKYLLYVVLLLYAANFFYFAHQYLVHKVYHHPWYSDVGLKEMVEKVDSEYSNYQAVVMEDGHYIPYLFYNKVLPTEFIKNSDFAPQALANGVRVKRFEKTYFNMPDCPAAGKKNVLYVCFGYQVPKYTKIVDVIRFRDGQPAVVLFEFTGEMSKESLPDRVEYLGNTDKRYPTGILPSDYEGFWPTNYFSSTGSLFEAII